MSRPGVAGRSRLRAQRAYNWSILRRHQWRRESSPEHRWLFVATMPNSGSTALAKTLETAPGVSTLRANGEGQWLVPQMMSPARWSDELELDYDLVRAVWTHHARRRAPHGGLIVDKSPANMMRMPRILEAFADLDPQLLVFTRDPVAVCASWSRRYGPQMVAKKWQREGQPASSDARAYHRALGEICGERMSRLAALVGPGTMTLRYEDLTEDPAGAMRELAAWCPEVGVVPTGGLIKGLKQYDAQPLRNMNAEQIAKLDDQQQEWVREGLESSADAVAAFGYSIEPAPQVRRAQPIEE